MILRLATKLVRITADLKKRYCIQLVQPSRSSFDVLLAALLDPNADPSSGMIKMPVVKVPKAPKSETLRMRRKSVG